MTVIHFIILLPAVLHCINCIAHCDTLYHITSCSASLYQMYCTLWYTFSYCYLQCFIVSIVLLTVIHFIILPAAVLHCIKCIAHCDTLFHIATCSASLYQLYCSLWYTLSYYQLQCFIVSNVLHIVIHFITMLPIVFHCIKCIAHIDTLFILLPTVLHCINCIARCDTLFQTATSSASLYLMYCSLWYTLSCCYQQCLIVSNALLIIIHSIILLPAVFHCIRCIAHTDTLHIATSSASLY